MSNTVLKEKRVTGERLSNFKMCVCMLIQFSRVRLFATLWTEDHQAPLYVEFSRQEYWSGLPCHSTGDLPHPENEPASVMSPALAVGFFTTSVTWEAQDSL